MASPLVNMVVLPRDTRVVYPESEGEPMALMMRSEWLDALSQILADISGAVTGIAFFDLTPADDVTPTLESVVWNGTLAITLDRPLTTIHAATYNGGTPPAGYKFTIILIQDAVGDREVLWDASYYAPNGDPPDGTVNALSIYNFISIGGQNFLNGTQIGE